MRHLLEQAELFAEEKPTEGGFSNPPNLNSIGGLENPASVKFRILQSA
jgi:hypothetical protein